MNQLRKIKMYTAFAILLSFLFVFQVPAFAQFESAAGSALLMEASTGEVLYEKNAEKPVPPASITKLMTLLLGFEALEKGKATWDDLVPVSEKAWKIEGSRMFLEVGTKVKYGDIITGISVVSANDGCIALAEYLSGSENAFVQVMNQRAEELGLASTRFMNATGLPAQEHKMSARDIAVLARHLMEKYPKVLEIESKTEFTFNEIKQNNRNPLLGVFQGADGLKTGWTEEAGYCLVGTAEQNGMRMISVILNTRDEKERLSASQELLSYGFKNFQLVEAIREGMVVGDIAVKKGKKLSVPVKVDSGVTSVVPAARKNDIKTVLLKDTDSLNSPAAAGTPVGKLEVKLDDRTLAVVNVSTAEDAPRAGFFELLFRSIGNFFRNLFK